MLSGANIVGGNTHYEKPNNEFYATSPETVEAFLNVYDLKGVNILEPSVGAGHIANVLKNRGYTVTGIDVIDRGYSDTIIQNYLDWNSEKQFDAVITNPPFSLAQQFIEKSLELSDVVIMFLKIQFLEGQKRKKFFEKHPPSYIYVFSNRAKIWRNGEAINSKTGKPWASTMCFAWYVWDKKENHEPVIRWI